MRRLVAKQMGGDGADLVAVRLDDEVPFSCARSGNCCTGRHHLLSNRVLPREFAEMWARLEADGHRIWRVVPGLVVRAVGVTSQHPSAEAVGAKAIYSPAEVSVGDPGTRFLGLMFRMEPDASMADGDRCVFLVRDAAGTFGCQWHRTRAQPTACALAPLAVLPDQPDPDDPVFFYATSRTAWCQGMREALAGERPTTTARAIWDANEGPSRLAELREFQAAEEESRTWERSGEDDLSPLAELYARYVPALRPLLAGY